MIHALFPPLIPVRRTSAGSVLDAPGQVIAEQLRRLPVPVAGQRLAIAVGSRGIDNLVPVLREIIHWLQSHHADPFIVAAMGSHGGGSVEGQLSVLHGYGVTEEALGVPVRASIRTVCISGTSYQGKIHLNEEAWNADGMIIVNRVKRHTDIQGSLQSGLCKMIAIGLGNKKQAEILHNEGLDALSAAIPLIAEDVISSGKIICGVALVENGSGKTAHAEVIPPGKIISRERELLAESLLLAHDLPTDNLDVLIIDEGGKDYAGSFIDTHVIGRMRLEGEKDLDSPVIHRIVVCGISVHSQGNAAGIGLADFITRRLFDTIDFASTYTNCISCIFPERARIPMIMETPAAAAATALETCRASVRDKARIIRIHDTLNLENMYISEALLPEVGGRGDIEVLGDPLEMFDERGELLPF